MNLISIFFAVDRGKLSRQWKHNPDFLFLFRQQSWRGQLVEDSLHSTKRSQQHTHRNPIFHAAMCSTFRSEHHQTVQRNFQFILLWSRCRHCKCSHANMGLSVIQTHWQDSSRQFVWFKYRHQTQHRSKRCVPQSWDGGSVHSISGPRSLCYFDLHKNFLHNVSECYEKLRILPRDSCW